MYFLRIFIIFTIGYFPTVNDNKSKDIVTQTSKNNRTEDVHRDVGAIANNKEQKYFCVIYVGAFDEKTSLAINKTNITSTRKTTNKIRVRH